MSHWFIFLLSLLSVLGALSQQCGKQAGGAICSRGLCCSRYGYCGSTRDHCINGCQSQCAPGGSQNNPKPRRRQANDITSLISESLFDEMLKHRNDENCPAKGFYTYDAFVAAARSFDGFATTGDVDTRKREVAAFLAQTSHETTGGWAGAPDGKQSWGYCNIEEQGNPGDYCVASPEWPCAPGKKYYGRGPIQISYNFNYGKAGEALDCDLIHNPELVATDPIISFKTALWFWMTPQSPKPSCHDVITDQWQPSDTDIAAGRIPGYGLITNIINGGIECDKGFNPEVEDRIEFYKR